MAYRTDYVSILCFCYTMFNVTTLLPSIGPFKPQIPNTKQDTILQLLPRTTLADIC